jgi:hypothetical protein
MEMKRQVDLNHSINRNDLAPFPHCRRWKYGNNRQLKLLRSSNGKGKVLGLLSMAPELVLAQLVREHTRLTVPTQIKLKKSSTSWKSVRKLQQTQTLISMKMRHKEKEMTRDQ